MQTSYQKDFYHKDLAMAMMIKTQSLCLYVADISDQIPPFKVEKALMLNYQCLEEDVKQFLINENIKKADLQSLMKVLIRRGMELVMQKEGKFTPDLYLCYQTFSKYYPQWEKEMRSALKYFLDAPKEMSDARQFVESFSPKIINEIRNVLE